jgi:hypothetical protein
MNHACRPSTPPACIGHTAHDVGRPSAWPKGGPTAATAASGLADGTRRNQSGNLGYPIAWRECSLDDAMPWKRKQAGTTRAGTTDSISIRDGKENGCSTVHAHHQANEIGRDVESSGVRRTPHRWRGHPHILARIRPQSPLGAPLHRVPQIHERGKLRLIVQHRLNEGGSGNDCRKCN